MCSRLHVCSLVGFLPAGLPTSCLTIAPRFDTLRSGDVPRRALGEINGPLGSTGESCTARVALYCFHLHILYVE
jgi:hypothetical protein